MRLLFKQRFFSWLDSYDIYDEDGNTAYTVEGRLAWGHCLEILDAQGGSLGMVKQEVLTFLPRFALYVGDNYVGCIQKEFSLFTPRYNLDCNGWEVEGDLFGWDYQVVDGGGAVVGTVSKEVFHFTDTYVIDVPRSEHAFLMLMIVLAIDAANCDG